jgi:hypothetical protein
MISANLYCIPVHVPVSVLDHAVSSLNHQHHAALAAPQVSTALQVKRRWTRPLYVRFIANRARNRVGIESKSMDYPAGLRTLV